MSRPSWAIVLAEDRRQQTFVRRYLQRKYPQIQIRNEPLPAGRAAGEQWVRQRYAKNIAAYRTRAARAETALVVAIDADTADVDYRVAQLRNALGAGQLPRAPEERITHLIPKRNIETWILCLNGHDVDEATDYRHEHGIDDQTKSAAETLFDWSRENFTIPPGCVPSLQAAIPEIRRLDLD
jgi:hypothetical protein